MREREKREPQKENIGKGELLYLHHPGTEDTFSGYGLTMTSERKDRLAGVLMIDRPRPADPAWLKEVHDAYGECQLVPMTAMGERGLVCQMQIEPDSLSHLNRFPSEMTAAVQRALEPLLEEPPAPVLNMSWDAKAQAWRSEFFITNELPDEIREVFEHIGYGCLAAETDDGIVHVCHASDADIEGFGDKPVWSQWQLILMPTAPLIRLNLVIPDRPDNPFKFESFLNVAAKDQAQVLEDLANQEELYLAFYGDDLGYRYTKAIPHTEQQWQQVDELMATASEYWAQLPPEHRDFNRAKAEFMSQVQ